MTKEEKEKLIELSDLNREDNIRYISSEAQGIAIDLDSDRSAPSICKLERAYICGRRKSEKRIEELEKENAELKSGCGMCYRKDKELLIKAKEIMKSLCEMVRELNKPNVQLTDVDYSLAEAENFLKEDEKSHIKEIKEK